MIRHQRKAFVKNKLCKKLSTHDPGFCPAVSKPLTLSQKRDNFNDIPDHKHKRDDEQNVADKRLPETNLVPYQTCKFKSDHGSSRRINHIAENKPCDVDQNKDNAADHIIDVQKYEPDEQ